MVLLHLIGQRFCHSDLGCLGSFPPHKTLGAERASLAPEPPKAELRQCAALETEYFESDYK